MVGSYNIFSKRGREMDSSESIQFPLWKKGVGGFYMYRYHKIPALKSKKNRIKTVQQIDYREIA
jgi:hypothetical protein